MVNKNIITGAIMGLLIWSLFLISLKRDAWFITGLSRDINFFTLLFSPFFLLILFCLLILGSYVGFVYAESIKPILKYSIILSGLISTLGILSILTGRLGFFYGTGSPIEIFFSLLLIAFSLLILYHSFTSSYHAKKENRHWLWRFIMGVTLPPAAFFISVVGLNYLKLIATLLFFSISIVAMIIYFIAMLNMKITPKQL